MPMGKDESLCGVVVAKNVDPGARLKSRVQKSTLLVKQYDLSFFPCKKGVMIMMMIMMIIMMMIEIKGINICKALVNAIKVLAFVIIFFPCVQR